VITVNHRLAAIRRVHPPTLARRPITPAASARMVASLQWCATTSKRFGGSRPDDALRPVGAAADQPDRAVGPGLLPRRDPVGLDAAGATKAEASPGEKLSSTSTLARIADIQKVSWQQLPRPDRLTGARSAVVDSNVPPHHPSTPARRWNPPTCR
jgi:hypothetical protein